MAARRRRVLRSSRRAKDLIWVTTVIEASILEATPTDIAQLVIPGDWSGGNAGFDRATIMGIRGWLGYSQMAAATLAEATGAYVAVYVTDGQVTANSMDPSTATEYAIFDVMWTDGIAMTATTGTGAPMLSRQLDVRARRKITTAQELRVAASVNADTASAPRFQVNGVVRTLLRLDPPS